MRRARSARRASHAITRARWCTGAQAARVALVALALWGCDGAAERQRQGEAVRLAQQIDRLRDADNAHKRAELHALDAAPCSEAALCSLKELCRRAYALHQEALDEIGALRAVAAESTTPPPRDAAARLVLTEQKLEQARAQTEECAREQVRVVRRYLL